MNKYEIYIDCDYATGYLRYGHFEGIIEANSKKEAEEKFLKNGVGILDFVVDDCSLEDYELDKSSLSVTEVE